MLEGGGPSSLGSSRDSGRLCNGVLPVRECPHPGGAYEEDIDRPGGHHTLSHTRTPVRHDTDPECHLVDTLVSYARAILGKPPVVPLPFIKAVASSFYNVVWRYKFGSRTLATVASAFTIEMRPRFVRRLSKTNITGLNLKTTLEASGIRLAGSNAISC